MWDSLNNKAGAIGLILSVLTVGWAAWRYLAQKHQELRLEKFKIYHQLIKELVEPDEPGQPKMLDRQVAIIFELRRIPEYFEASLGILKGLRPTWDGNLKYKRLLDEMDVSITKIEKKSRNVLHVIKRWVRDLSTY